MGNFSPVATYGADTQVSSRDSLFRKTGKLRLHDRNRGFAQVHQAMIGRIKVGRVRSSGHDVSVIVDDQITVLMPLNGSITCEIQDATFRASANEALIVSPSLRNTRVLASQRQQFEAIPLMFPLKDVQQRAEEMGASYATRKRIGKFGFTSSSLKSFQDRHFLQLVRLLTEELSFGESPMSTRSAESWSHLLTEKLVVLLNDGSVVDLPIFKEQRKAHRHVFKAEEFMHEHFADIKTVYDIASKCEISVRSLEMAFKSVRAQSPMAHLTEIRLDQVRKSLGAKSVTQAALDCGFSHLGRFSIAYKRRFGEAPSETICKRQLRH